MIHHVPHSQISHGFKLCFNFRWRRFRFRMIAIQFSEIDRILSFPPGVAWPKVKLVMRKCTRLEIYKRVIRDPRLGLRQVELHFAGHSIVVSNDENRLSLC